MNCEPKYEKVTRVEVIDDTGRAYTNWNVSDLQFSLQDDERTLKVFIVGKKDDQTRNGNGCSYGGVCELVRAISKVLRHGMTDKNYTNLVEEIGDVQTMINLLVSTHEITWGEIEDRVAVKMLKLNKYGVI